MKQVTLYRIEAQEVLVADYEKFLRSYHFSQTERPVEIVGSNSKEVAFIQKDLPIHRVRWANGGEKLIAVDPLIEEIISAPIRCEYEEKIYQLDLQLKYANSVVSGYETRISDFNSKPWYKRIFSWKLV